MPNKPSITFTEDEVRLAYIIGLATGRTLNEINMKIITVTADNTVTDKGAGTDKIERGTSKLAQALATLKNAGYVR